MKPYSHLVEPVPNELLRGLGIVTVLPSDSQSGSVDHHQKHYEVIIIGSGPAGYTAGVYTSRANLGTLLISGTLPRRPSL